MLVQEGKEWLVNHQKDVQTGISGTFLHQIHMPMLFTLDMFHWAADSEHDV